MKLGENIYRLRTAKKLSQGDLADQLEVSRQSVSKWENDVSVPDLDKLIRMSELFSVTLDTLVNGPVPEAAEEAEKPAEAAAPLDEAPDEAETPADDVQDSADRTVTVSSGTEDLEGKNGEKVYPPTWPVLPAYEPGPTAGESTGAKRYIPWKRIAAATAAVVMLSAALFLDYSRLFRGGALSTENVASTPSPSQAIPEAEDPAEEDEIWMEEGTGYISIDPNDHGIYSIREPEWILQEDPEVAIFIPNVDSNRELDPINAADWVTVYGYTEAESTPEPIPAEQ